jgi:Carboxypeptidase regulatory-like domain
MLGLLIWVANSLLYVGDAHAQFGSASVLGYVRDNGGAVVPNAVVKLSNIATDVSQTARTDNEGKYEFNSVPIGDYQISTGEQYKQSVRRPIEVVVLNCWVTETKLTPCLSKASTILAKSDSARGRRSTL